MSNENGIYKLVDTPENATRAYRLDDGMVISICDNLLEFENDMFHEVEEYSYYEYIEGIKVLTTTYQRTGKQLTLDQASALAL